MENLGYDGSDLDNLTIWTIVPERYHHEIEVYLRNIKEKERLKGFMRVRSKKKEMKLL